MPRSRFDLHPLTGRIGALVADVDLASALDEELVGALRSALLRHRVLFFRDQRLDPDAQQAFAARFGPVTAAHPTVPGLEEHPRVFDVDAAGGNVAVHWHTDVTFVARPPLGSVLRAVVAPPVGGDTLWADTAAAYDDLSPLMQDLADSLQAVHTNQFDYGSPRDAEVAEALRRHQAVFESQRFEVLHPVVRVHPESGERALLLGGFARRLGDVSTRDTEALLALFRRQVERHENIVRWRWRAGDVAFWDNRTTQHRAVADFGSQPRRLHRVTIAGDLPRGVDGRTSKALQGDSRAYDTVAA